MKIIIKNPIISLIVINHCHELYHGSAIQTHIQIIHPDKQKHHFATHSITRYKFNRFNFQNIFQINLAPTVIQAL